MTKVKNTQKNVVKKAIKKAPTRKPAKTSKTKDTIMKDVDMVLKKMVVTYTDAPTFEGVIKIETDKWLAHLNQKKILDDDSFKAGVCYGLYKYLHFLNELTRTRPPSYAV
jgi:hypothetical protein